MFAKKVTRTPTVKVVQMGFIWTLTDVCQRAAEVLIVCNVAEMAHVKWLEITVMFANVIRFRAD